MATLSTISPDPRSRAWIPAHATFGACNYAVPQSPVQAACKCMLTFEQTRRPARKQPSPVWNRLTTRYLLNPGYIPTGLRQVILLQTQIADLLHRRVHSVLVAGFPIRPHGAIVVVFPRCADFP